jgi:hypothetical protein
LAFELTLEPVELLFAQIALAAIDERARGPGAIVEQRLVPGRAGIVNVERARRGFERA